VTALHVRPFAPGDTDALVQLWHDCGLTRPWNDPYKDIQRHQQADQGPLLVGTDGSGTLVASVMVGYDGHRGWIYYLAVHPAHRRQGHGRHLVAQAEQRLAAVGCPKLNLLVRDGNEAALAFYERLGYAQEPTASLGKRLISDL